MYIIDVAYFKREYSIPNTDEMDSKALAELNMFIDEKAPLVLQNALGNSFAIFNGYLVNGALPAIPTSPTPDPVPAKWRNLVSGVTYTKDSISYKWKGLVWQDGSFKGSILTPFVYYWWLSENRSYVSGVGEVLGKAKNAPRVDSTGRLVRTWNKFVAMYQANYSCGCDSSYIWNWDFLPYYDGGTYSVSLLQFLRDNPTDYPDIVPITFELQNVWAI